MSEEQVKLIPLDLNNSEHLHLMYVVRTHPDVDRYLCNPPPDHFSTHIRYLNTAVQEGKKFFIIQNEESLCGYCHVTFHEENLELGWALHPNWWRKGIGKRSVSALIRLLQESGFSEEKPLILIVKKENIVALSLYKKMGFFILKETNDQYSMQYQPFVNEERA